jgi:hypothetical protein
MTEIVPGPERLVAADELEQDQEFDAALRPKWSASRNSSAS